MSWVAFTAQWLQVLLGIVWFGCSLALAIFFIPAISHLPIPAQREIGAALGARAKPIIDVVAPSILVLGIIHGTLLGRSTPSRTPSPPPTASPGSWRS